MKLKAPQGSAGCSHGETKYKVDETGHIEVPRELAVILKESHGYTDPEKDEPDFKTLAGKKGK